MRLLFAALMGALIVLPALATVSFAQNQQDQGSQAQGSASGVSGYQAIKAGVQVRAPEKETQAEHDKSA